MFWNKTDLHHLKVFTVANLKARYRNTFYGFAWVILNPILMYLVQVFAFTTLFQVKFPNFAVYLFSGLFPWIFIVQSVEMCTGAFIYNFHILKNYPVNPLLLIAMQVLDNFINFMAAYSISIIYLLLNQRITGISILYSIVPGLSLLAAVTSMGVVFSALNVRYRDVKFVVSFVFSLLFYLTPIFYSINLVKTNLRVFLEFNPIYILLRPFQQAFMDYPFHEVWRSTLHSLALTSVMALVAYLYWKKVRNSVILYV